MGEKMSHFKYRLLILAFTSIILHGCGGGGGNNTNSNAGGSNPITHSTSLLGSSVKGVVSNGIVKVYNIDNAVVNPTAIANGFTDTQGNYQVQLELTSGNHLIKIETSGNADGTTTQVKCDNAEGCYISNQHYTFGQFYPVDNNFKLAAIVTISSGVDQQIYMTTLTHAVSALTLQNLQNLNPQNDEEIADLLTTANNTVANLLEIDETNFSALKPVDLTSLTTGDQPTSKELAASLIAGAVTKLTGQDGVASLDQVMQKFSELIINQDSTAQELISVTRSSVVTARTLANSLQNNSDLTLLLTTVITEMDGGSGRLSAELVPPAMPSLSELLSPPELNSAI